MHGRRGHRRWNIPGARQHALENCRERPAAPTPWVAHRSSTPPPPPRARRRSRRAAASSASSLSASPSSPHRISRLCSPKSGAWRRGCGFASTRRHAERRLRPRLHARVRQEAPSSRARARCGSQWIEFAVEHARGGDAGAPGASSCAAAASCARVHVCDARVELVVARAALGERERRELGRADHARERAPLGVARAPRSRATGPCPRTGRRPAAPTPGARLPRCTGASRAATRPRTPRPSICAMVSRCARSIQAPRPVRRRGSARARPRPRRRCRRRDRRTRCPSCRECRRRRSR